MFTIRNIRRLSPCTPCRKQGLLGPATEMFALAAGVTQEVPPKDGKIGELLSTFRDVASSPWLTTAALPENPTATVAGGHFEHPSGYWCRSSEPRERCAICGVDFIAGFAPFARQATI